MTTVKLNQKQSKEFAYTIYADILSYIDAHMAEYEEFLKNEESDGDEDNDD